MINLLSGKFIKNRLFLYLILILTIILIIYLGIQVKNQSSDLEYRKFVNSNLESQIQILRDDYHKLQFPSPGPNQIPFVSKEVLNSSNTYSLDCYNKEDIISNSGKFSWLETVKKNYGDSNIIYLCLNNQLPKDQHSALYLAEKVISKPGLGSPGLSKFGVYKYEVSSGFNTLLASTSGNYLSGNCNKIIAWTKSDHVYYQCGGGDGVVSETTLYRIDLSPFQLDVKVGIAESCYTNLEQITCKIGCSNSGQCNPGYFCNLEDNSCVKNCKTNNDCNTGNICKPYGPVLGCN